MGKVITFINENGGVGKTSLIFNSGWELAKKEKVLFIDFDGQKGNLTFFCGIKPDDKQDSMLEVIEDGADIDSCIVKVKENLYIVPAGNKIKKLSSTTRMGRMKQLMNAMRERFDYIFIDVNPNPDMRQFLALTSADYLIIPMKPDPKALEGSKGIAESVVEAKEYNENLRVLGMVMNFYDSRTGIGRDVLSAMDVRAEKLGSKVFKTKIRQGVALCENVHAHEGVIDYDPRSNGAADVAEFVKEMRKEIRANG